MKLRHMILFGGLTVVWTGIALVDHFTGAGRVSQILSAFCAVIWLAAFAHSLILSRKEK